MKNWIPIIGFIGILAMAAAGCSTTGAMVANHSPPAPSAFPTEGPAAVPDMPLPVAAMTPPAIDMPATVPDSQSTAEAPPTQLVFTYAVRDTLDVQVIFESDRAYDAVQLGLSILAHNRGNEEIPLVEDRAFFPKYFALINLDISDGLLYISEREATVFAKRICEEYQRKVIPAGMVTRSKKKEVVENFAYPAS